MKTRLFLIIALWAVTLMAMAQEMEPKPKYPPVNQEVYDQYIEAARKGNLDAQLKIMDVTDAKDIDYGFYWMRKVAEQGHDWYLRLLLAIHSGFAKDYIQYANKQELQYWLDKSTKLIEEGKGSVKLAVQLIQIYFSGINVPADEKKALSLIRKVMEQPHPDEIEDLAIIEGLLGCYYMNGYCDVEQDDDQAFYWLSKSVEHEGKGELNGPTHHFLGLCYYNGQGTKTDYDKAVYWLEKASKENDIKLSGPWLERAKKKQQEALLASQQKVAPVEEKLPVMPIKDVTNVDENIPQVSQQASTTYAVIIGNEQYENEAAVPFAEHDAQVFAEYVKKTLGVPEKNIRLIANAGLNRIRGAVRWLKEAMDATGGQGKVIVYYAGHGIPDEANKNAYLLPVDGIGSDVESAYSLTRLYKELGALPAERITVFLDACFSGAKREGDMMASARGVAIKVKEEAPQGKMIVFTAAQGDETAYPYTAQKHGMFTYYLLKKLQETKGNTTLGELGDYLTAEVKRQSFVENNKVQTPSIVPSSGMQDKWRDLMIK
ncbi:MAG: caspase family protein [Prevotella sp.]|nr:caspase family protein [Prevotella sp.]